MNEKKKRKHPVSNNRRRKFSIARTSEILYPSSLESTYPDQRWHSPFPCSRLNWRALASHLSADPSCHSRKVKPRGLRWNGSGLSTPASPCRELSGPKNGKSIDSLKNGKFDRCVKEEGDTLKSIVPSVVGPVVPSSITIRDDPNLCFAAAFLTTGRISFAVTIPFAPDNSNCIVISSTIALRDSFFGFILLALFTARQSDRSDARTYQPCNMD